MTLTFGGGAGVLTIPGLTSNSNGNLNYDGNSDATGSALSVSDSGTGPGNAIFGVSAGAVGSAVYGYSTGDGGFGVTGYGGGASGIGIHGIGPSPGSSSFYGEGPMVCSRGITLFTGSGVDYDQITAGARTAAGTYGATEQTMLQTVYDALRTLGLLS